VPDLPDPAGLAIQVNKYAVESQGQPELKYVLKVQFKTAFEIAVKLDTTRYYLPVRKLV